MYDVSGNVVNRVVIDGNVGAENFLPLHPMPAPIFKTSSPVIGFRWGVTGSTRQWRISAPSP